MYYTTIIVFILSLFMFEPGGIGNEWPDWRGPNRDGTWNETGVMKKFKSDQLDIKWSVPVSAGYSGPSVADGKVYLTDRIKSPEHIERVLCFNAENGKEIWTHTYDCRYEGIGYPAGPRASVIIDGNNAYSLGTMGHLYCLNKENGDVIWERDLNKDYDIRMPIWGIAAAPLIYKNKIILHIGGEGNACVVALEKNTGKEIWKNLEDDASYVAPILVKQGNTEILVIWSGQNVVGMDPETGKIYWTEVFIQEQMIINISTPAVYNNYLFVSSFFDGALVLKLNPDKPEVERVWRRKGKNERNTDALHACISTPVILDGYIYGTDSYGELRCLELLTGNRIWEDQTAVKRARWANIHFIQNGDLTYMFNENGELIIADLNPKQYTEISRAKLIEPTKEQLNRSGTGVTWTHPAFAYGHVFIRSDKELVCADLREK